MTTLQSDPILEAVKRRRAAPDPILEAVKARRQKPATGGFISQVPSMLELSGQQMLTGALTGAASARFEAMGGSAAGRVAAREAIAPGSTRQGYRALLDNLDPGAYQRTVREAQDIYTSSLPSEGMSNLIQGSAKAEQQLDQSITVGRKPYSPAWFARQMIQQAPQLAATVGATMATGGVGAALTGAMLEGGSVASDTYQSMLADGRSQEAALKAAFKAMREYAPLAGVTEAIAPGIMHGSGSKLARIAGAAVAEGATESVQQVEQEVAQANATGNPIAPGLLNRAVQAGATGFATGGAVSVITPGRPMLNNPQLITDYVQKNPEGAAMIAQKAKPTQADFKAAGIQGEFRARQRERIADGVREQMQSQPAVQQQSPANTPAAEATAPPSVSAQPENPTVPVSVSDTASPSPNSTAPNPSALPQRTISPETATVPSASTAGPEVSRTVGGFPFTERTVNSLTSKAIRREAEARGIKIKSVEQAKTELVKLARAEAAPLEAMGAMSGGGDVVGPDGTVMPAGAAKAQQLANTQPFGRPDLANPGTTDPARTAMDAIDEVRKETPATPQTMAQWDAGAEKLLADDRAGVQQRMESSFVEGTVPASPEEQRAQMKLVDQALQRASTENSAQAWTEAFTLATIHRDIGGTESRVFRARADPKMGLAQRMGRMVNAIVESSIPEQPAPAPGQPVPQKSVETIKTEAAKQAVRTMAALDMLKDQGMDLFGIIDRAAKQYGDRTVDTITSTKSGAKGLQNVMQEFVDAAKAFRRAQAMLNPSPHTRADKVFEYWVNSILSGPSTQIVNVAGNVVNTAYRRIVSRAIESSINVGLSQEGAARFGELPYVASQIRTAAHNAFVNTIQSWRNETPILEEDINIWRELAGKDKLPYTTTVEIEDYHKAIGGKLGRAIRTPVRALGMMDELIKTFNTYSEVAAMAYRRGTDQGLSGDELHAFIETETANKASDSWADAMGYAKELAFQEPLGKAGRAGLALRSAVPGARYIVPFMSTPWNIYRQGMKIPLAPLATAAKVLQSGASVARGKGWTYKGTPLVRDMANNIVAIGLASLIGSWMDDKDEAGRPRITGSLPSDKAERERWERLGITPASIRLGDAYYSFARIEPFATAVTTIVDTLNGYAEGGVSGAAVAGLTSPLNQIENKTFLRGIADVYQAVEQLGQGASAAALNWMGGFAASWVPNAIRSTMRAADDVQRDYGAMAPADGKGAKDTVDAFVRATRFKALPAFDVPPPKVDIWGRDIQANVGPKWGSDFIFRLLSPISIRELPAAVKADMLLMNWNNRAEDGQQVAITRSPPTLTINGRTERMTEAEYERFEKRAGQLSLQYIEPNLTDKMVREPNRAVAEAVKKVVSRAREAARAEIVKARNN